MVLFYGLLRALAAALRRGAAWRHAWGRRAYEQAEREFQKLEAECKADEVQLGRPAAYAAQLRLLKHFERRERARLKWVALARKLQRRESWERQVRAFSGRKLPYTFGVIDMALVMKLIEVAGINPTSLSEWFAVLL